MRKERVNKSKKQNQRGASLVEYSLLVALIAVVAIGGVRSFGESVEAKIDTAGRELLAGGSSVYP
jgi:Flp pilus assembly pilin Flp